MSIKSKFIACVAFSGMACFFSACSANPATTKHDQKEMTQQQSLSTGTEASPLKSQSGSEINVAEPIHPSVVGVTPDPIDVSGSAANAAATRDSFADVHFDYDRYDIRRQYEPTLHRLADWMVRNPNVRLTVEGHCDERGTVEYNLALGERRAAAVSAYLTSSGIDSNRIVMVSYGKEQPLDEAQTEEAFARNRRGHFAVQM